jgi:nitrogen regulatory protein PII
MQLIKTIIRPHKLEDVREALSRLPVSGITVSEVWGKGGAGGQTHVYRGHEYVLPFAPGMQVELVVKEDVVTRLSGRSWRPRERARPVTGFCSSPA